MPNHGSRPVAEKEVLHEARIVHTVAPASILLLGVRLIVGWLVDWVRGWMGDAIGRGLIPV